MSKSNKQQVPKVRFTEFSGDWEKNILGKIKDVRDGTHDSPKLISEGYPLVTSKNLKENGLDMSDVSYISEVDYKSINKRSEVTIGDILFAMIGTIGNPIIIKQDNFAIKNVALIKNTGTVFNEFLLPLLKSDVFEKYIYIENAGNTQKFLALGKIREFSFHVPTTNEQVQIGNFFQQLDKLIELQIRAVESAETYKKAMLQKMFPQKGEKVPRVRFEGFSGDWVTTHFKDVADVRRGLTYSPSDVVTDKKGIRVLRSSNIDEDTLVISDTDVFVSEDAVKISYIKMNEILITAANGSSRLVGKHAIISKDLERAVHGGFMLAVSTSQPEFINSWMNGVQYKKMLQLVQGGNGAIGNLSRSMLEECKITLPCLVEQEKIGNFFQKLDQNIESEKKKLEQYQTMKRAMLQRMFV